MQDIREKPAPTGLRADAFRAAIIDRQIVLDFGRALAGSPAQDEVGIELSSRILLDPSALARLISALRDVLGRHTAKWPGSAENPAPVTTRAPTRSHAEPNEAGEKAALLLRLVSNLGCPYYQERSFRISDQYLAANRYLLTLNAKSIGADFRKAVLGICKQISMPADLQQQADDALSEAKAVHFGFEGDARTLYKVYLERRDAHDEGGHVAPGTPILLHVAFKWDSGAPGQRAISRYHWYPNLSVPQIAERMAAIFGGSPSSPSLGISRSVLEIAAGGMNLKGMQYLEVKEDGNSRSSFDLNVYNAGLQLKELQPQLSQMREQFGIRPGEFQALYDQIKTRIFGHLAGGIHRNGKEFFNVYYGVQRFKG